MTTIESQPHFLIAKDDWATPQLKFDRLNAESSFTLDNCGSTTNAKGSRFLICDQDRLPRDRRDDPQFLNHRYSRVIRLWVWDETARAGRMVFCLLPARADAHRRHAYAMGSGIRFIHGWFRVGEAKISTPVLSAIVILGTQNASPSFSNAQLQLREIKDGAPYDWRASIASTFAASPESLTATQWQRSFGFRYHRRDLENLWAVEANIAQEPRMRIVIILDRWTDCFASDGSRKPAVTASGWRDNRNKLEPTESGNTQLRSSIRVVEVPIKLASLHKSRAELATTRRSLALSSDSSDFEEPVQVLTGDVRTVLTSLPSDSVHSVVTSPPYWGVRDYGVSGQIGAEPILQDYVQVLTEVFREVRRVLRGDGTLWLNIGNTYSSGGRKSRDSDSKNKGRGMSYRPPTPEGLKAKDLVGVAWLVARSLQLDGWFLRNDVIWNKPNCQPESVKDRLTVSHEYLFLFSKSEQYRFHQEDIRERRKDGAGFKNRRTVWNINTEPYPEAHFAVFPTELVRPCILASTRRNEVVLDPFFGSGTVGRVALELGRRCIGIELNHDYVEMARRRITSVQLGLFNPRG